MRIHLASYQSIMLNRGGPTYKILHLRKALEEIGIDVRFFDMWDTSLKLTNNDIVHIFNASVHTYALARNLVYYGARYVINPIFYSNHPAWKLHLYQKINKASKLLLKRSYSDYDFTAESCYGAQKVLPNTIAEGEILVKGLGVNKDKIKVIHNGVEKRFAEADSTPFQKKYGLKDFVLFVGHLGSYRKNGVNIIKALQKLDHKAVIIADIHKNTEGEWCRKEIEKSKNIKLIEWIDHNDPLFASAYGACHTFILPTKYETPGRAALEAGLAGANIVITPFGGTKEYFDDFADYANPYSVKSIKEQIEKSLNKDKNDKLKNHIKENFLWDMIAKKTVEIYQKI